MTTLFQRSRKYVSDEQRLQIAMKIASCSTHDIKEIINESKYINATIKKGNHVGFSNGCLGFNLGDFIPSDKPVPSDLKSSVYVPINKVFKAFFAAAQPYVDAMHEGR